MKLKIPPEPLDIKFQIKLARDVLIAKPDKPLETAVVLIGDIWESMDLAYKKGLLEKKYYEEGKKVLEKCLLLLKEFFDKRK